MSFFDPKVPTGQEYFTIDFSRQVPAGATIVSAVCVPTRIKGSADATPANMLSGGCIINGTKVSQKLINGVDGTLYLLTYLATLSDGQVVPEIMYLWVRAA